MTRHERDTGHRTQGQHLNSVADRGKQDGAQLAVYKKYNPLVWKNMPNTNNWSVFFSRYLHCKKGHPDAHRTHMHMRTHTHTIGNLTKRLCNVTGFTLNIARTRIEETGSIDGTDRHTDKKVLQRRI